MGLERRLIRRVPGRESPISGRSNTYRGKTTQRKHHHAKEIDRRHRILRFSTAICHLWKRVKALIGGTRHHRAVAGARDTRIEHQVMLVDPYFSVPVIPVSKV